VCEPDASGVAAAVAGVGDGGCDRGEMFAGGLVVAVRVEADALAEEVGQVEPHAPPSGDRLGRPQVRSCPDLIPRAGTRFGTNEPVTRHVADLMLLAQPVHGGTAVRLNFRVSTVAVPRMVTVRRHLPWQPCHSGQPEVLARTTPEPRRRRNPPKHPGRALPDRWHVSTSPSRSSPARTRWTARLPALGFQEPCRRLGHLAGQGQGIRACRAIDDPLSCITAPVRERHTLLSRREGGRHISRHAGLVGNVDGGADLGSELDGPLCSMMP
jgi:hypothetical protein